MAGPSVCRQSLDCEQLCQSSKPQSTQLGWQPCKNDDTAQDMPRQESSTIRSIPRYRRIFCSQTVKSVQKTGSKQKHAIPRSNPFVFPVLSSGKIAIESRIPAAPPVTPSCPCFIAPMPECVNSYQRSAFPPRLSSHKASRSFAVHRPSSSNVFNDSRLFLEVHLFFVSRRLSPRRSKDDYTQLWRRFDGLGRILAWRLVSLDQLARDLGRICWLVHAAI